MLVGQCQQPIKSVQYFALFQALIDAHDQIGAIWLERGSGVDEKLPPIEEKKGVTFDESPESEDMGPIETVKVVGIRKVPGQPLGLTVSCFLNFKCDVLDK